jgi:hypothetical protein
VAAFYETDVSGVEQAVRFFIGADPAQPLAA